MAVMAQQGLFYFTTNMWALLNKETQIVLGVCTPDADSKTLDKLVQEYDLILMTPENSPATIGDKYKNGKFIKEGKLNA